MPCKIEVFAAWLACEPHCPECTSMQPCMVSLALENSRYLVCDPKFYKCHLHLSLLWLTLESTFWFHSPSSLNSFCQELSQIASSIAVHICFLCYGKTSNPFWCKIPYCFFSSHTRRRAVYCYIKKKKWARTLTKHTTPTQPRN